MFYVYVYYHPETNIPFYVGKGKGNRMFHHLKESIESSTNKRKTAFIQKLIKKGKYPVVKIYKDGLTEEEAYNLESRLIIQYGRKYLDENGILFNVVTDARPPPQKGKKFPNRKSPTTKGKPGRQWSQEEKENHKVIMKKIMNRKSIREKCAEVARNRKPNRHTSESKAILAYKNSLAYMSQERRDKLSQSKTGDRNPAYGTKWFNDGVYHRQFIPGSQPKGWNPGKLKIKRLSEEQKLQSDSALLG